MDGASKNLLAVKVRNLKPNTAYSFALNGVSDFAATTATTDDKGKLEGFVKSDTFNATDGATYTVVVKEGDATVASAALAPVTGHHKGFGHGHKRHHKHGGLKQARPRRPGAAPASTTPQGRQGRDGQGLALGLGGRARPGGGEAVPSGAMELILPSSRSSSAIVLIFLILMHSGKEQAVRRLRRRQRAGPLGGGSLVERNLNRWTVGFAIAFALNTILLIKQPW